MSDDELFYDAISSGPTPDGTPERTAANKNTSPNVGATLGKQTSLKRTENTSISYRGKDQDGEKDHEKLSPRGCDPNANKSSNAATNSELHSSRRAPGGNKVLENIAKFEAAKVSPVRDKSKSPDLGLSATAQDKVLNELGKAIINQNQADIDEDGWNKWEAGNANIDAHVTQGNVAEVKDISVPEEDGWKEWEGLHQTETSDGAIERDEKQGNSRTEIYSFAQPFPVERIGINAQPENTNQSHLQRQTEVQCWVDTNKKSFEDSFGYSHAANLPGNVTAINTNKAPPEIPPGRPSLLTDSNKDQIHGEAGDIVPAAHEEFEQTIYDSVCSDSSGAKTLDRSGASELDAKLNALAGIGQVEQQKQPQTKEFGSYNWQRKAKYRSRALKRSSKRKGRVLNF